LRIVKTLFLFALLAWALLALAVRLATPLLAEQRPAIEALLSERVGAPVAIGELRARWYGLGPLVELDRVAVGRSPEVVEIDRVLLDLDTRGLFSGGLAQALRLTLSGARLTLVRESDGRYHVEGVGGAGGEDVGGAGADLPLPARVRLFDTRLVWIDRAAGRAPRLVEDIDLVLERTGSGFMLGASLSAGGGQALFRARLDRLPTGTDWSGESYLRVDDLDVAGLLGPLLPPAYGLRSLHLDLEAWTVWEAAAPRRTEGRAVVRDLDLRPVSDAVEPLLVERAATDFSLRREAGGLTLGLRGLELDFGSHRWPATDIALAVAADGSLSLAADYLRIEDLVRVMQVRWPWQALAEPAQGLRPSGELRDLRVQFAAADGAPQWHAMARFAGLATDAWGRIPGVSGLSGELHAQHDSAVLELDSADATVRFAELFRDPIEFNRLSGSLRLDHDEQGWRLQGDRLAADTPHISTLTRVRLEGGGGRAPFIDLQTDFRDGDAAFASRYYPVAVMGPPLVRWLDRSIRSGRVREGTALIYGPLQDFAFERSGSGRFEVLFETEDVLLDYREGWPRIEQLAARVHFYGNRLEIEASSGEIAGSRVGTLAARIDSLAPIAPVQVRGDLAGPLADMLKVLGEGRLGERFGDLTGVVRGQGEARLALDFDVPLGMRGEYRLDGRLDLAGAALDLPDWDLAIGDIRGSVRFDLAGVYAEAVRATLLDTPVAVSVGPAAGGGTTILAEGRFDAQTPASLLPQLAAVPLEGAADLAIRLEIPATELRRSRPALLRLESDLRGVGIGLPPPLQKAPDEPRPLALDLPLGGGAAVAGLSLGDRLAARFTTDGNAVGIRLGGGSAALPASPGVGLRGRVETLDLGAWSGALARLEAARPARPGAPEAVDLDLAIGRVQLGRLELADVAVQATRRAGAWRGSLSGESLAGRFQVPAGAAGLVSLDLERLALALPAAQPPGESAGLPERDTGEPPLDPSGLPRIRLDAAEFSLNRSRLGRLLLELRPEPNGVRLVELGIVGAGLELEASGHWIQAQQGAETRVGGSLRSDGLGDLLVALGYTRQLEATPARSEFLLQWPGGPADLERAALEGKLSLDLGAGRLVELDPGAARVVGLLNLNALTRRLRLDFSDLYKKGYSFDSIRGDLVFAEGLASTDNLEVEGPTGRIELRGTANLAEGTLNQHVRVIPDLDATLPIASAIAGGPVAGIAVLLAQKLMEDEVDRLNRFEYRLSGPWDDPEVTRLDSGGALSRILRPGDAATEPQQPVAGAAAGAQPADAAGAAAEEAGAAPSEGSGAGPGNPLRGVLRLLEKGEAPGADLPGSGN
jgi:uncharacterized protein (TIGR02099 family)